MNGMRSGTIEKEGDGVAAMTWLMAWLMTWMWIR